MIEFENVQVSVPSWGADGRQITKILLDQITTRFTEARISIIGANGSGKSSLLRLINGLILPASGRVLVDGLDTKTEAKQVRKKVGFVFTDPLSQLVQSTPIEDIELSLRKTIKDKNARREKARQLLANYGLENLAHQSIYELSGGERQLVSLTSVLAVDPSVVVADEPTTLLDLRNKNLVFEALFSLKTQLIYASHDLEFVAKADRTLVVDDGQIVFDGEPEAAIDYYRTKMATGH